MKIYAVLVSCGMLGMVQCEITNGESFLTKFRYGIELVHRLFSTQPGAKFFTDAFKQRNDQSREAGEEFANNFLTAVVESLSDNQQEMTVAGVKISVLIARWISDVFRGTDRRSRSGTNVFSPLEALARRPQVRRLMGMVHDPELAKNVLREATAHGGDCVLLLICKMEPFIRGMQRSLHFFLGGDNAVTGSNHTEHAEDDRDFWAKSRPMERLYLFLPGMTEFLKNGDVCDERHPSCIY